MPRRERTRAHDPVTRLLVFTAAVLALANAGAGWLAVQHVRAASPHVSFIQERIDSARAEVRRDSLDPAAHLGLAYAYLQAGRLDDALYHYELVLSIIPSDTAALHHRGVILFELGRTAEAVGSISSALAMDPAHAPSSVVLIEHHLASDESTRAAEIAERSIENGARSAELYYLAGVARERLGDRQAAQMRYLGALEFYPGMLAARSALARLESAP